MAGRKKTYLIVLADDERASLSQVVAARSSPQAEVYRARIVLECAAHPDWSDEQVAASIDGSAAAVRKWRKRFTTTRSLKEAPRSGRPRVFQPEVRAQLTALACSVPLETATPLARWSCAELATMLVTLGMVYCSENEMSRRAVAQDSKIAYARGSVEAVKAGGRMREKLFTLTRSRRDELERRYKQTNERRIAERLQAILLLDAGHNRDQVARILHLNPKTITRWIKLFVRVDLDTFCTLQSGGNEAALNEVQQQQLAAFLDEQVRSTKEAIAWVEETFEVSYTESGMRKLLQRMDYRYKQPAIVPAKADPEAQAAWLESYGEKRGP